MDCLGCGEVGAKEVGIEAGGYWGKKGGGEGGLGGGGDSDVRAGVFEGGAEGVVEGVVAAAGGGFGDGEDGDWVGLLGGGFVGELGAVVALGEVQGGLHDARLAGGADEDGVVLHEGGVAGVELDARVHHFLLAECSQAVGAQGILVGLDEGVGAGVRGGVGVDLINGVVIFSCL